MRIWIDVSREGDEILAYGLTANLKNRGFDLLITIRRGMERVFGGSTEVLTIGPLAKGPFEEVVNELSLYKAVGRGKVKDLVHISLASLEASRVAFGLRIPLILILDDVVSVRELRLIAPLADVIIYPKIIRLPKVIASETRLLSLDGYLEDVAVSELGIIYHQSGTVLAFKPRGIKKGFKEIGPAELVSCRLKVRAFITSNRRLARIVALRGIPTLLTLKRRGLRVEQDMIKEGYPLSIGMDMSSLPSFNVMNPKAGKDGELVRNIIEAIEYVVAKGG